MLEKNDMNNSKIAVVSCWFGHAPWYFHYFLHSCRFNPTIDFYIITDLNLGPYQERDSENVKFVKSSLNEIKKIATKKLGFEVQLNSAYKLCDFKPTYGLLFSDILNDYDFWAHADIDIIYGDLRNFLTEEILNKYDVISSRHDYITGSFCLFRNSTVINELFSRSKDYVEVFTNQKNYCFDECNFLFKELENNASILDFNENIQSMTHVVKKEELAGKINAFFDFVIIEGTPGNIIWNSGKLYYKSEFEAMYYHLIKFKVTHRPKSIPVPIPNKFAFTQNELIFDI